jgi:hypothetical protein
MQVNKQTETQRTKPASNIAQRFFGAIFGAIEAILAFRLVFKLLGADPANVFVKGLYDVSHFFTGVFEGIFAQTTPGIDGNAGVFEPATLIAIVVVALIAWTVLKLLTPRVGTRSQKTEYTEFDGQEK